jgi:hypothetical protein
MALKMDRQVDAVEISYFLNEVAERGNVVSVSTAGSGIALDSPSNVATVAAAASGSRPIGILLNDFVDIDTTRTQVNWMKDQSLIGNKCTILTKGWVVTNRITGTPTALQDAVLGPSGTISGVNIGTLSTAAAPKIGRFRSGLSEEGFAKVYVDL